MEYQSALRHGVLDTISWWGVKSGTSLAHYGLYALLTTSTPSRIVTSTAVTFGSLATARFRS